MSFKPRYRLFIGVALLLLYTFIAIPTRLWHVHECAVTTTFAKDDNSAATKISAQVKDYCDICSHQYAPYIISGDLIVTATPTQFSGYINPYQSYTAGVPVIIYDTRGSPVL